MKVSAAVFGLSLVAAAFLLPVRVDGYLGPASTADVEYPRWLFLTLHAVATPVFLVGLTILIRPITNLFAAFSDGTPNETDAKRIAVGVGVAGVLLWSTVLLWLAVLFGNDAPPLRSVLELVVGLSLIVLVPFAAWWGARSAPSGRR